MVSKKTLKDVFCSRLKVGILVILSLVLVCCWSYWLEGDPSVSQVVLFGFWIALFFPVVFVSLREILLLRKERLFNNLKTICFLISGIICVPILISYVFIFSNSSLDKAALGYGAVAAFISLFLIWIISKLLVGVYSPWSDFYYCAKNKSFTALLVSACLFWNSVFFITVFAPWYFLTFMLLFVTLNDSFALLFGSLFGRTPLIKYSPNKSVEGLVCAVVTVLLISVGIFFLVSGIFEIGVVFFPFVFIFLLFANLGDIYFSMHKRIYKIKDYSFLLKSHGGFWDRFDSHCFALSFGAIFSLLWFGCCY